MTVTHDLEAFRRLQIQTAIEQIQEEEDQRIRRIMTDKLCWTCRVLRSERPPGHPCPDCLAADVMED